MKNTYKIDFANNTLTMTKAFEAAANEYGSEEYKLLQQLRADFPGIQIIRKTRRPSKTARPNKNLTYYHRPGGWLSAGNTLSVVYPNL